MIEAILSRAVAGERLSYADGVALMRQADLLSLGQAADAVRRRLHRGNLVTYVVDRNINYTNICIARCRFCAFWRDKDNPEAYVLPWEELWAKIDETVEAGGTALMIQGGLNPELPLSYFEEMLREIKRRYPGLHIHSFSPPEIVFLAEREKISVCEVLLRLRAAGLDSLPGGGAEILVDRVRRLISPAKIDSATWLSVMREAHLIGMKTTATMMFGHIETPEERVLHMLRIRELQDETGGFTAFIPWTFQPTHTRLAAAPATAVDYLRTLAISRLMLDNVPNLQVSWVTQGAKMAQVALAFGANDFGSTMLEENVVRAAGVNYRLTREEIIRCIKDAGFRAAQRNTLYQIVQEH